MSTTDLRNLATIAGSPAGNKITVEEGFEETADLIDDVNDALDSLDVKTISKFATIAHTDNPISTTSASFIKLNFSSGLVQATVDVSADQAVFISGSIAHSTSSTGTFSRFVFFRDSNQLLGGATVPRETTVFSTLGATNCYSMHLIDSPAAGTYTYSFQWRRESGAGTVYARFPFFSVFTIRKI